MEEVKQLFEIFSYFWEIYIPPPQIQLYNRKYPICLLFFVS